MTTKVVPPDRFDWPSPYKDATEKYSSQVRLTPDHRSLIGYVAGEPFPIVDSNDPDAGTKSMCNVAFRPISSDEYELSWFDWSLTKRHAGLLRFFQRILDTVAAGRAFRAAARGRAAGSPCSIEIF